MVVSGFSRGSRVGLFGLLRRVRPARRGARPESGLRLRRAHRSATPGFFRLARCVAGRGCRGFPLSAGRQSLPPPPPPRTSDRRTHFLIRRGAPRPAGCRARGLRPCATCGGRAARPPAPRGAPTRGAVFFIVFRFGLASGGRSRGARKAPGSPRGSSIESGYTSILFAYL